MKQNITGLRRPSVYIAIGYKDVYDDFSTVKPLELIANVPTAVVLNFVAKKFATVFYAQSDSKLQYRHIKDFIPYLSDKTKKRVFRFLKRTENNGNHPFIYGTLGCHMIYRMALQLNVTLEDCDIDVCQDEYEPIFKALLYCNSLWTNQQIGTEVLSISDISLKMDVPLIEGKHYKDFRPQLFKAHQFFSFCENDAIFSTYIQAFYKERKVNNWAEYIVLLFNVYYNSIKSCLLPNSNDSERQFLSQFIIDSKDEEVDTLWDAGYKGINYLRNHFLYELPSKELLVLDANLLIDKFYQGLKFDLYNTVKRNGLLNPKGRPYKDQRIFNSTLGEVFSEKYLLYSLLNKIYSGGNAVKFTGEEMKKHGINAELDYYLRIEDTLYLVEYKDVLLSDDLKYSGNINNIKRGICERLCMDDGANHRKGAGQLLYNIDRILNNGLMNNLDPEIVNVRSIFPLLITTDSAFSAFGVNLIVTEEFGRIMKSKYKINSNVFINIPIISNIDSIILLSYRLYSAKLQLSDLLIDYIRGNWMNLSSFDNFVFDECRETEGERREALGFLFGDLIKDVDIICHLPQFIFSED